MKNIAFTPLAFKEYTDWFEKDPSIAERIKLLIGEIDKDPFHGMGKPEPLRGAFSGYWSRRINREHRLVYKTSQEQILIIKCQGHY